MRNWVKTWLFVSAFSPALVSVGLAHVWAIHRLDWQAVYYAFSGLLGGLSSIYIIAALRWHGEIFPFVAKKVESNDALMLGVVVSYFIPFLAKANEINPLAVLGLVLAAAVVFWISGAIAPSPTLRILGYRFYKVESDNGIVFTLITQRDIIDPKQIRQVNRLTSSMLLEANA